MSLVLHGEVDARDAVLDLAVGAGETVAVLGPNGAGKSTLLGLLAGLVRADRGRAELDGDVLFDVDSGAWVPPHRRRIALLDQRPSLFPHLRARQNVEFGARAASRTRVRERATAWLEEVEAGDLGGRLPTEVSGGQAQRIALARALAAEPRVVLLDEPLGALDVTVAPAIRRMLRRVLDGRRAVLVTHDVLDAWMLADRVVVIEQGRITAAGAADDVLRHPRTAFVGELVGLGLVRGVLTGTGLRLADGRVLPADVGRSRSEEGADAVATVRPSAVRLADRSDAAGVDARVTAVEPRGEAIRIRTDLVPVDVPPWVGAELGEGDPVRLVFAPDAVEIRLL